MTTLPLSLAYLDAQLVRSAINNQLMPPREALERIESVLLTIGEAPTIESKHDELTREFIYKTHTLALNACLEALHKQYF